MYDLRYLKRNYGGNYFPLKLSKFSLVRHEIDKARNYFNKEDINICEIGCGDGRHLRACADIYNKCTFHGIDFFENLSDGRNINFLTGNFIDLLENGFEDKSLHLIYAIDVVEHLSILDIMKLGELLNKKLEVGGVFLARVPNTESRRGLLNQFGDLTHVTSFNKYSGRQLLDMFKLEDSLVIPDSRAIKFLIRYLNFDYLHKSLNFFYLYSANIFLRGRTGN